MEQYIRLENEGDMPYLLRLVTIKMEQKPSDLEWSDIVNYCNLSCHYDSLRKAFQPEGYGAYFIYKYMQDQIVNRETTPDSIIKEYDLKRVEFEKEKIKFYDQRTAYNKMIRESARNEEDSDIIERAIISGNLPKFDYTRNEIKPSNNDLLVTINDIHYGADVQNYWNTYNSNVCVKDLENYADEIFSIQDVHKSENCFVFANGDLVSGNIHPTIQIANKENLIEQIMGVSEAISNFLNILSTRFNKVTFIVVAGNHSRLNTKDNSPLGERADDLIPWYVSARLQNIENVVVNKNNIDSTMALVDIRGKNYLAIHGDYENGKFAMQSVAMMSDQDIYCIVSGHLHHNYTDYVQNIKTVMAGSFLGMDDYCVQKRIIGKPQQIISVCTDKGIKCTYDIEFARETLVK